MIRQGGLPALHAASFFLMAILVLPLAWMIYVISFADGRHDGDLTASRQYLGWDQGLVAEPSGRISSPAGWLDRA